jgi:phenylalanyl-tRNA synthetase beta chain
MLIPLSWLGDYVALEMPLAELVERLTISVAQVGRVVHRGVPEDDGNSALYVVGRVIEAGKHPNADRLQLCRVDVGESEPRQIVCGAWNFGAGATVAVALPGAVLPGGQELEQTKLRGEVSDGMILSERELELGHDHTGILVLEDGEPGTPLADVFPLTDVVLELETTPNRPDLLSVYGLAREVAALWNLELDPPPGRDPHRAGEEEVDVRVDDLERCPRYVGRAFTGVQISSSPLWMKARLTAGGMRPISNVVDITNYVMLALGNPLHAFDRNKLRERRIVVRPAREGEQIRTLDGTQRRLDPSDLVIADAEEAVAIAGVMGSVDSEVDETTTELLLEAANFEPFGILKTSERLGLRTEGSARWEKGVDPYLALEAAVYATELFVEHAAAAWVGETDTRGDLPQRPVVRLRPERVNALNGLEVPPAEQQVILGRLGFEGGAGEVTVPTWRARDVTREIDLVEEVARTVLDRIPFTLPARRELFGRLAKDQRMRRVVEDVLVGAGFDEVYTPTLVCAGSAPGALQLPVPLTAELAELRTRIVPSLVEAVRHNLAVGNADASLFEIARVYLEGPEERWHVAAIAETDFGGIKGTVEVLCEELKLEPRFAPTAEDLLRPGRAAEIEAGWLGELHPTLLDGTWSAFELDLATLFCDVPDRVVYEDVITYPPVRQDLAFVVDERVAAGDLVEAARAAAGPELREVRIFDVYRGPQVGEGKKSIAIATSLQARDRTLSDEDAAGLRERIRSALAERFGAELRTG